jgi:hypothetical protein
MKHSRQEKAGRTSDLRIFGKQKSELKTVGNLPNLQSSAFSDIVPCSLVKVDLRAGFLLGLFFDPEAGNGMAVGIEGIDRSSARATVTRGPERGKLKNLDC